jgi:hypothetical protein
MRSFGSLLAFVGDFWTLPLCGVRVQVCGWWGLSAVEPVHTAQDNAPPSLSTLAL